MSDVTCPYCGEEQEINHDDGYGFDEDVRHEQECINCDRGFEFETSISYNYSIYCIDKHEPYPIGQPGKFGQLYFCENCDHSEYKA